MRITRIEPHPLTVPIGDLQHTSQGSSGTISILLVVVETDAGITGVGEGLARFGPRAYAELLDRLLAPGESEHTAHGAAPLLTSRASA